MTEITPQYLRECFDYFPTTGELFWLDRRRSHFGNEAAYKTHLRHRAGNLAGGLDTSTGYIVIGLHLRLYYAHRIAWAMTQDEWPKIIDHIDGDKSNNRISNLRSVTQMENNKNTSISKNNTSGAVGVNFDRRAGKWRARVLVNYREVYSNLFATREAAIEARARVASLHGFHPNHGREPMIETIHEYGARHNVEFKE